METTQAYRVTYTRLDDRYYVGCTVRSLVNGEHRARMLCEELQNTYNVEKNSITLTRVE